MTITSATPASHLVPVPEITAYRRRSRAKQLTILVVTVFVLVVIISPFASSSALRWEVVGEYLFDPKILSGVGNTLLLTFVAMAIAIVIGGLIAAMRGSRDPTLRAAGWAYVSFMRAVPLLVLILLAYFLAAFVPKFMLGIPFGPEFFSIETNTIMSPFLAAVLALGFGEGAYTSEIIRGGILAVDRGQQEAAEALGMRPLLRFRRITAPQAFRVIVPTLGNQTIGMLKATSLVQVIGYTELLTTAQRIYAMNFQTIPLLIVVTIWYLVLTIIGTLLQHLLERRMNRGY